MTEAVMQAAVVELARVLGWMVYHPFDSRRSEPGYPDLTLAKRGRVVFAELKSATGATTPAQEVWLQALDGGECEVYVWTPKHWTSGEIERILRTDTEGRQGVRA